MKNKLFQIIVIIAIILFPKTSKSNTFTVKTSLELAIVSDSTIIGKYKNIVVFYKQKKKQYFIAKNVSEKWIIKPLHKETGHKLDTIKIELMKINGNDSDLVIISWSQTKKHNQPNIESWILKNTIKKVWNINEMQELFSVQTSLNFDISKTIINDPSSNEVVEETASCNYKYDFYVDKQGSIILTFNTKNFSNNCENYMPDKEEGVYILSNMKYYKKK